MESLRKYGVELADLFNDYTLQILTKALDADALNHLLISNNIANYNTPGYQRMEVSFKEQLKGLLQDKKLKGFRTHPNHIPIGVPLSLDDVEPLIVTDTESVMRPDGNNIDIDKEMGKLSENSGEYGGIARMIQQKFQNIKTAIGGQ